MGLPVILLSYLFSVFKVDKYNVSLSRDNKILVQLMSLVKIGIISKGPEFHSIQLLDLTIKLQESVKI